MRAGDLAQPYPSVSADDDALTAARQLVRERLPALLVLDPEGRPYAIVPGSQLLRALLPDYVVGPALASDMTAGDIDLPRALHGLTVAEWLPRHFVPPAVGPDTSPVQVAALMARTHSPLVAIVVAEGRDVRLLGAITAAGLMHHFLGGP
ncbi:hypothetical protein SSP35_56_00040 [Streptomyces sp. NBRC 110611]|uniref:CBS domain-containing protein n=1 Tax=Streptomyces sp. NBRC 110611 TaxID=1621259 RepID=UPI000834CCE9|nr:CBS domain-containing protein [Streptomyces sp. NBRC 110611]GAU71610.1 hypothetical protein SSP35_56_00040 [Streptomyces sp. NBRC 110611]